MTRKLLANTQFWLQYATFLAYSFCNSPTRIKNFKFITILIDLMFQLQQHSFIILFVCLYTLYVCISIFFHEYATNVGYIHKYIFQANCKYFFYEYATNVGYSHKGIFRSPQSYHNSFKIVHLNIFSQISNNCCRIFK
jgi:hypothetical protein